MQTAAVRQIEQAVRKSLQAKGWHDGEIGRHNVVGSGADSGEWFILRAKYKADTAWQILGRRRTRSELLILLNGRTSETLHRWPTPELRRHTSKGVA